LISIKKIVKLKTSRTWRFEFDSFVSVIISYSMHRTRERVMNIAFEDHEDEFIIFAIRRPRWIRERAEDFDNMDDTDFVTRYRPSKPTVLSILEKIEAALEFETDRLVNVLL